MVTLERAEKTAYQASKEKLGSSVHLAPGALLVYQACQASKDIKGFLGFQVDIFS